MSRSLIEYLTFAYSFLAKGRGILDRTHIERIRDGADSIVKTAPQVLTEGVIVPPDFAEAMEEAGMINDHIAECADWLLRLEIN